MSHIHVKDKATGHEYVVRESLFDAEKHEKTGKSVRDAHGDLVSPKFKTTVDKAASRKTSGKAPAESGQQAETEKE